MRETVPTTSDWQALYQAAMELKEIEAWTWMYDSNVFGVQDPASGEIGSCSSLSPPAWESGCI